MKKFGQYLVENGIVDEATMIQVLSIQRRRNLIPLGEIALQKHMLTPKELLDILNIQSDTGQKFGDIAIESGYLTPKQMDILLKIQKTIHGTFGSILVELKKVDKETIDSAWEAFNSQMRNDAPKDIIPKTSNIEEVSQKPATMVFKKINQQCPVCDSSSEQFLVDPELYNIVKSDIDKKTAIFKWKVDLPSTYNPIIYEVWLCKNCGYSAHHTYFLSPTVELSMSPLNFSKKVGKILDNNQELKMMQEYELLEQLKYANAIKYTIIAIYIFEQVPAIVNKDSLMLAKHYQLLSWLFREIEQQNISESEEIKKLIEYFKRYFKTVPQTEVEALEKALTYYDNAFYESSVIDKNKCSHEVLQMMGRINIMLGNYDIAKEQIQEASKEVEYRIKIINERVGNNSISDVNKDKLIAERKLLNNFLQDNIELLKPL